MKFGLFTLLLMISQSCFGNCQQAMGAIVHFAQLHRIENLKSPLLIDLVTQSQFSILKALKKDPSGVIFVEGLTYRLDQENYKTLFKDPGAPANVVKATFSAGIPERFESLSPSQKAQLFTHGGAVAAYFLGIVPTLTPGATLEIESQINDDSDRILIFERREEFQIQLAQEILSRNPKERVVFIWGRDHDFTKYFTDRKVQKIQTLSTSSILLYKSLRYPIFSNPIIFFDTIFK